MARVSIVLASANSRDPLLATVDSILEQTTQDFDLFIADDGSTDGTGVEILRRLGPDPSRSEDVWWQSFRQHTGTRSIQMMRCGIPIHYLHQISPRGPAAARNRAIALTGGEFLAIAEPGDVWSPGRLNTLVDLLDAHPESGACMEPPVPRKGRKPGARRPDSLGSLEFREVLGGVDLRIGGAIVRRAAMDGEPLFDENLAVCEEYDFWLRVASRTPVIRMHEPLQISAPPPVVAEWGLERFRVYALEKAYQGGQLDSMMRHAVAKELVLQCERLVTGYRVRENQERANFYDRKRKRFADEVAKLDSSDPSIVRVVAAGGI